jgi:hypothetical protein
MSARSVRFAGLVLAALLAALQPSSRGGARAAAEIPLAPSGPTRVSTWVYYAVNDVNASVSPSVMARYADYAEDGEDGLHARPFKAAGGRYSVAYLDPAYVPYCYPPFAPPAGRCEGGVGKLIHDERAWFHGRDGTRVRRYVDAHFQYQEAIDPLAPAAHRAWRESTAEAVRKNPTLDFIMADDAGGPLRSGDMNPVSSEFYHFNDAGVEITSDDVFRDAWIGYLEESVRPLILNGNDPVSGLPSYGGAFLRAPRVIGAVHEGCFRTDGKLETDLHDSWRHDADSLLANTALARIAVCFMMGTPTPRTRLYALASWWLTFDPRWSVAAPIDPVPGESALLPELAIVPGYPTRTPFSSVRELRLPSGAAVREFRRCYQDGRPVGPCAAVVNPTLAPVPFPALAARYGRRLALGANDALHGGRADWVAGIPRALAPASAAIVAR